jgi:hypothetical protein
LSALRESVIASWMATGLVAGVVVVGAGGGAGAPGAAGAVSGGAAGAVVADGAVVGGSVVDGSDVWAPATDAVARRRTAVAVRRPSAVRTGRRRSLGFGLVRCVVTVSRAGKRWSGSTARRDTRRSDGHGFLY